MRNSAAFLRAAAGLLTCIVSLAFPGSAATQSDPGASRPKAQWSWVEGTYWYVTQQDLPAVETDLATQEHQFVSDQTVWHVEEASNGYFWGKAVVALTGRPAQCLGMVGSIAPDGKVQITFTLPLPGAPPELSLRTNGIGTVQRQGREWRFNMQMTSGIGTLVTHWASMRQCKVGGECNERLPGVNVSLQGLMATCTE